MIEDKIMNKEFIDTAMILARMYGVAETLHPIPCMPMDTFLSLINEWTVEYIKSGKRDVVLFFENKMAV